MIKLEFVRVVQFYLSEKEELKIEESTGIFGPNAVGKSAFLDGIQIVMMGANQSLMSFNAQADEKTKRTIRSYCLGQYGQGEQRARDNATTYITLVWRDTETTKPISTGVCIYASSSEEKHKVLGRYVAPGVDLLLSDHLEIKGDVEQPMEWSSFRLLLQRKSESATGIKDVFYEDGKDFVVGLLSELRVSMGRIPDYKAFTRSFKFAMRMRFDKSIDHIVRYEILQDSPTNTGKFKEITNSFKQLKELIARVSTKIESGKKVAELYKTVRENHIDIATWKSVSARVNQAICHANYEETSEEHEELSAKVRTNTQAHEVASRALSELETKTQTEYRKMVSHTSHKDFGKAQNDKINAEKKKTASIKTIQQLFSQASQILRNISLDSTFAGYDNDIRKVEKQLISKSEVFEFEENECIELLSELSNLAKVLAGYILNGPMRDNGQSINLAGREIELIGQNISRLNTGKADLRQETISLVTEFSRNGLSATPVCDLVRVSDTKWQPVIESYLASNVEALLLPEEQEESAYNLYRAMDSKRNIFNVKVVRSANFKSDSKSSFKAGSVAELIEGENQLAVAYLRSQLGDLMRANSDKEALSTTNTLTSDGMLHRRGAFERLKLVKESQLKIGIQVKGRLERLNRELKEHEQQKMALEKVGNALMQYNQQLTNLHGELPQKSLKDYFERLIEAQSELETSESILSNLTDSEYQEICKNHETLLGERQTANQLVQTALENKSKAVAVHEQSGKNLEKTLIELNSSTELLENAEREVDFDPRRSSEFWDGLIDKYDIEYNQMQSKITEKLRKLDGNLSNVLSNASRSFGEFLIYNDDKPSEEIRGDWRLSEEWLTKELNRLEQTELHNYQEEAAEAYKSAQDTFCTDVASILYENFNKLDIQFKRLRNTLDNCPTFSNGERYRFKYELRPQFKELHRFVNDVATYGPQNDLLGGPGEIPVEFDSLVNDKATATSSSFINPLDDYREFYDFDIEIRREDPITNEIKIIGLLSDRLGTASGGEHRAPLYVIAGAALASAYRMDDKNPDGLRLILLDEAFDKMSMNNLVATMRYFEDLGLQVLLASPGENKGALDAFLHRYYDVLRDPSNQTIYFEGHDISIETRIMMRADLPEFYPELIDKEMEAVIKEQEVLLHG